MSSESTTFEMTWQRIDGIRIGADLSNSIFKMDGLSLSNARKIFFLSVLSVDVFSAPIFNVNVAAAVVVVKLIIWHNLDRLIQRSLLLPSSRFFSSQTNLIVVSLSRKHHPHTVYLFLLLHIHSTPRYFKKGLTFKHKLSCSNYVGFADQLWCHIWSALWLSPTMAPPLTLFTFA